MMHTTNLRTIPWPPAAPSGTPRQLHEHESRPPVIRNYGLSIDAFDHLKAMQRLYSRTEGRHYTNSEALERILKDHEAGTYGA